MKIHLISVVGNFVKMLPAMIRHYQQMGVDVFHIHVHARDADDPVIDEVREILDRFRLSIEAVHRNGTWIDVQNTVVAETLPEYPDDWFIIVDQDELQVYPKDLRAILEECEHEGYDHLHGCFVDRLGPGGTLPPMRYDRSLSEQFPVGAFLTHTLLQGYPRKVVATMGHVKNSGSGSHWAYGGNGCPIDRYHVPVHHFKWSEGIVEHLRDRVEILRKVDNHWMESKRVIDYLAQNRGRIDPDDPVLFVAPCDPDYQKWDAVTRICLHCEQCGLMPEVIWASKDRAMPIRIIAGGTAADGFRGNLRGYRPLYPPAGDVNLRGTDHAAPMSVYSGAREGSCSYALAGLEAGGRYLLRLHFAEHRFLRADERFFDVWINRQPHFQNLDVVREADGPRRALVKQAAVTADDLGFLFVDFREGLLEEPIICGLEVLDMRQSVQATARPSGALGSARDAVAWNGQHAFGFSGSDARGDAA